MNLCWNPTNPEWQALSGQRPSPQNCFIGPVAYNGNLYVLVQANGTLASNDPAWAKARFWKSTNHGVTWSPLSVDPVTLPDGYSPWKGPYVIWPSSPACNTAADVKATFLLTPQGGTGPAFDDQLVDFDLATETWGAHYAGGNAGGYNTSVNNGFIGRLSSGKVRSVYARPTDSYLCWALANPGSTGWASTGNVIFATPSGYNSPTPITATVDSSDTMHIIVPQQISSTIVNYVHVRIDVNNNVSSYTLPSFSYNPSNQPYPAVLSNIFAAPDGYLYVPQYTLSPSYSNPTSVRIACWKSPIASPAWSLDVIQTYSAPATLFPYQLYAGSYGGNAAILIQMIANKTGSGWSNQGQNQMWVVPRSSGAWGAPQALVDVVSTTTPPPLSPNGQIDFFNLSDLNGIITMGMVPAVGLLVKMQTSSTNNTVNGEVVYIWAQCRLHHNYIASGDAMLTTGPYLV